MNEAPPGRLPGHDHAAARAHHARRSPTTRSAANLRAAGASWAAARARISAENPFAQMRARAREIRRGDIADLPELLDTPGGAGDARPAALVTRAADAGRGLPLHHRPRGGARRDAGGQVEVDGHRGDQAQRGARGRRACAWSRPTSASGSCSSPASTRATSSPRPCTSTRSRCASCSMAESGRELPTDREALVAHARTRLREVFASADIGISGVNFGGGRDRHDLRRRERGQRAAGDRAAPHPRRRDGHGAGRARTGTRPPTSCRSSRWRRSATTRPATST